MMLDPSTPKSLRESAYLAARSPKAGRWHDDRRRRTPQLEVAVPRTRSAARIRVPKALRGPMSAAGRQGRRRFRSLRDRSMNLQRAASALGGSTWLASLSLLALSHRGSAALLRAAPRVRATASVAQHGTLGAMFTSGDCERRDQRETVNRGGG